VLLCLSLARPVAAQERVLKMGTVITDGSGFARELRAFGRDVERVTNGQISIKWYMGGVAGDELKMAERVQRGQLDGIASGGMMCERLAPSLRVVRIPGLLQTWPETTHVVSRIKPILDEEMRKNGYVNVAEPVVGPSIAFTRRPAFSLAELQAQRLWIWDIDEVLRLLLPEMGLRVVPLPIHDAASAYDTARTDGFATPAAAALGFQWSPLVRHYTDLRMGFIVGCVVFSLRAFDGLSLETQTAVRAAAARGSARFEALAQKQEEELLTKLFKKQGLAPVKVSPTFRAGFFDAARAAREKVAARLVSPELLQRVQVMLSDFRSEHR
jgi:TRAP-type C4-dicarboxylate transport system substrate-binding protein